MKRNNRPSVYFFAIMCAYFLMQVIGCKKDNNKNDSDQDISGISVVQIPDGTFTMGSPVTELYRVDDETQHTITLSAFKMSKYELTNTQYSVFLNTKKIGSNGIYAAGVYPSQALIHANSSKGLTYNGNQWAPVMGYENNPVVQVSRYGATEFANYVGGSLTTEAQWEYDCRGNTTPPFNSGNCLSNAQANYYWDVPYNTCTNTNTGYPCDTQAVGTFTANAYGLYDMHGNVWEWCSDWYGTYPTTPQTNPTVATTVSLRVVRGGGFVSSAAACRSAIRASQAPAPGDLSVGFRVVFGS